MSKTMSATLERQLTLPEVAELLGVSTSSVRRLIARGDLRAYRYGPRLIRVDPADLRAMREPVTSLAALRRGEAA
uniref:helix-turn-helix transcriptional regulator n=1 Tax=uncultured Micrococcus sp. TaxID=114051 RepID=UPI002609F2E6|nr:helix-turn-helix domain-containing protein [uncultured Micrococcus sp.]